MGEIPGLVELIAKFGIGVGGLAWIATVAIKKWAETKSGVATEDAKSDVIEMLVTRVAALEAAVDKARKDFDVERGLRLEAETKVSATMRRVAVLENRIRELGHDPGFMGMGEQR